MLHNLDFIYNRHSVRRFKDEMVPIEDVKEIIKAATHAPSGKNAQNWHFVIVKNKDKIEEMAKVVEKKNLKIAEQLKNEEDKNKFIKFVRFATVFRNAPITILVFASGYEPTGYAQLKEIGASSEEIHTLLKASPGMQNIGAAIENLCLAAAEMGYGTVWMTSPNYAAKELAQYVGFEKEGYILAAVLPLGIPEGEIKSPGRKPVEEVMTIIE